MLEGARIHRMIQSRMGSDYHAEVMLRQSFAEEAFDIVIEGRADGIIYKDGFADGDPVVIDEIKSTWKDVERLSGPEPVHLAQAKCYAYMFARQNELPEITVRMTYVNLLNQQLRYFHETYTVREITAWFEALYSSYKKWAVFEYEWKQLRNRTAGELPFPFPYREGQKELCAQVYQTIVHRKKLFIEAPTGVGKTVSTVFPSVKAVGTLKADKLFYLTAKTITRTVAAECFDILRDKGLRFKTVILTAKEKICFQEQKSCNPEDCPFAKGHFDRINDAIYDLLTHSDSFSRESIEEYAIKHQVCPFELGLDMSLFSDAVICDYNYVFDPNVYLRRFFSDNPAGNYIFLVDEAHNLVDRAIKMYSAELFKEDFLTVKSLVREVDHKLSRALDTCNRKLLLIKRQTEPGKARVFSDITELILALNRVYARLDDFLEEQERFEKREELLDFYFRLMHFINMYDNLGDNNYVIYSEFGDDGRLMLKLLCVDPSENLKQRLTKAVSTVFFSATLLPIRYYRDMLGAEAEDYAVYAKTVFDEKKRGLFIASDVSSKYTRRNELEYRRIAEYIRAVANSRLGNYMVFFPSHSFLTRVYEQYTTCFGEEEEELLCQKSSMNEAEREEFLASFEKARADGERSRIGFCVIGGIFSEGIDLKNDSLIGAVIVGTGIPLVCNERELMKDCYEKKGLNGFDYAYRFPGMNKVLQAAGRVIRTVDDIGVVALLDERFLSASYKKLFPREWSSYEVLRLATKEDQLSEFWTLV